MLQKIRIGRNVSIVVQLLLALFKKKQLNDATLQDGYKTNISIKYVPYILRTTRRS